MGEINKKNKTEDDEEDGADGSNEISPEYEEAVGYEKCKDDKKDPDEDFGSPPAILQSRSFGTSILDTNEQE